MLNILSEIQQGKRDAILYKALKWTENTKDDPYFKAAAVKKIASLLANIRDGIIRNSYVETIGSNSKPYYIGKRELTGLVDALCQVEDEDGDYSNWDRMPAYMDREEVELKGFCEVSTQDKRGYYGWSQNGKMKISNFLIRPLFHVPGTGSNDSRHIFEASNGARTVTVDVESKVFISVESMRNSLVSKGNFIFFGNINQLLMISNELLPLFPQCDELNVLGWQKEGFFAFSDRYFVPERPLEDDDQDQRDDQPEESPFGLKEIGRGGVFDVFGKHFLVPAASNVYRDLRNDLFENQRVLRYSKSPTTLGLWASKVHQVYGDSGLIGMAYAFCCLFRDIAFEINHNFPHLYGYGERSSGKNVWAASISSFFYKGRSAFNLNSGTDFAFFAYVQLFKNGISHLNEFDEQDISDAWFQNIKAFFDGEGRQKGKMGNRIGIETMKAEGGIMLTGQYLVTRDDNSVVTRSILCQFNKSDFTQEERQNLLELQEWEGKGLTSLLTEVIEHRSYIKKNYYDVYNDQLSTWRRATTGEYNSRIFQNHAHLATIWKLLASKLPLPVPADNFLAILYKKAKDLSNFVRQSDTLNEFWNTVVFLLDEGKLTAGWDFRVEIQSECRLRKGDGEEYTQTFDGRRKLLFLRLNNTHKHYQKAIKERTGKEGMTMENIKHYFSNRPYYIGQVKAMQFKRFVQRPVETSPSAGQLLPGTQTSNIHASYVVEPTTTSCYVFDYDILGCDLERVDNSGNAPF